MSQLRTVLPYFQPYLRGLVLGLALVAVANVFTIAGPFIMKLAIDGLSDPDVTSGRIAGLASLIVAAALLGGTARYGMRELLNGLSRRMECDLRDDFFKHLLRLDAPFYSNIRTGDLMTRASQDTVAVRMAVGPAIMYSVNTLVGFSFALVLMLWISPRLTVLALLPMIFLPPVVIGFGRVIHRRFEKIQEQFSIVSTMVQENLTGVRIVRAYTQERPQEETFAELNREYMRRNLSLVKTAGMFHPSMGLISGFAMVIVLWVGGLEIMAGAITVGDFVAFIFYLVLLIWPLIALGWVVNLFQRGAASMGRINRIMATEPRVSSPEQPAPFPTEPAPIEFKSVSFTYPGTRRPVLDDVSFVAEPGMRVAIVGPTGSGKSTLVSLIPRLFDPSEGEVLLGGRPMRDYDLKALRERMGVVPQDAFLFSETIAENIALGLEDAPKDESPRVLRSAEVAQLDETIRSFPKGYRTELGERGINLSGGQKQRATLARALARDPWILILDDALSAVDTHTEARILEDLRDEMRGRTSFVISHRVSAVMEADLILVLDDGRIVERGTHAELVNRGGLYAGLHRRQMLEGELEAVSA
jgi:ATP-binding cassette subfamily B multidrug efflux pump